MKSDALPAAPFEGNVVGSTSARLQPPGLNSAPNNVASYGTNNGRTNYRNGGAEVPLTVSSSMGSHSYRENRPSNDRYERSDRDRERPSGNIPRGSKDRPSGSTPYRGRSTLRSTSTAGPDVIFSSGYDSNRNSQRGGSKESFYTGDTRDNRDSSNSNHQKNFNKPWKSRKPFDSSSGGIETTQDYPSSSYRTVVYDHLATSSLEGIEALPHIKFSKGRTYLTRWWQAAKKWNLLDDDLKEIDRIHLSNATPTFSSAPTATATATVTSTTITATTDITGSQLKAGITSKQDAENLLKADSDRIAEALSQLIGHDSLSENAEASVTEVPHILNNLVDNLGLSRGADSLSKKIPSSTGFLGSTESVKKAIQSSEESKINELIDKTIQSVGSSESTSVPGGEEMNSSQNGQNGPGNKSFGRLGTGTGTGTGVSSFAPTLEGTDRLQNIRKEKEISHMRDASNIDVSKSSGLEAGKGAAVPTTGHSYSINDKMRDKDTDSCGSNSDSSSSYEDKNNNINSNNNNNNNYNYNNNNNLNNNDRNRDDKRISSNVADSWSSNKLEENEDQNRGNDRYSIYDRTYSESDMSVPIDELYRLCDHHKARVICIGDVHGCVEELKDLLRAVKYRPGDLVLLLGDLVAKGISICFSITLLVCSSECLSFCLFVFCPLSSVFRSICLCVCLLLITILIASP